MVYFTRTASPFCLPGFHFGMIEMTRSASLSKSGSTPRTTFGSTIEPSRLTTNCTMTRPCMPFSCAVAGYLTFFPKKFMHSLIPPGNSGISSHTMCIPFSSTLVSLVALADSLSGASDESLLNLNITGMGYFTVTAAPFCLPGFHFGMELITRKASASRFGSTPLTTLASATSPSLVTTICTMTLPWMPFS